MADAEGHTADPIYSRIAIAGGAFSPSAPISRVTLFAGRHQQVMRSIDVVYRRGQHGIIFGERGVGKTSMANLIADFISRADKIDAPPRFLTPRVNCTASPGLRLDLERGFWNESRISTIAGKLDW